MAHSDCISLFPGWFRQWVQFRYEAFKAWSQAYGDRWTWRWREEGCYDQVIAWSWSQGRLCSNTGGNCSLELPIYSLWSPLQPPKNQCLNYNILQRHIANVRKKEEKKKERVSGWLELRKSWVNEIDTYLILLISLRRHTWLWSNVILSHWLLVIWDLLWSLLWRITFSLYTYSLWVLNLIFDVFAGKGWG